MAKHTKDMVLVGWALLIFITIKCLLFYFAKDNSLAATLLWYCTYSTFILGYALITGNRALMGAVALVCLPAQGLWIYDFILNAVTGNGLGRMNFFDWYAQNPSIITLVFIFFSFVQHVILIPVSWWALRRAGLVRSAWGAAVSINLTMGLLSFLISTRWDNVNCIHRPCDSHALPSDATYQFLLFDAAAFGYFALNVMFWFVVITLSYGAFCVVRACGLLK